MRKNRDTTRPKLLGLSRIIKNTINICANNKKKENNISLVNCIANIIIAAGTIIAVFVALNNTWTMLSNDNRPILRLSGIERLESIDSIPKGMNFYTSGLDMSYDSSMPYHTVFYKITLQNLGNGTMNNFVINNIKFSMSQDLLTPNNELIGSNVLSHSNGLDFRATYSETKIVEDRSYYVFEKNEKIDIYICGGVNDIREYHQFYYLFSYQDIYKKSYFNILSISGNNNDYGFNYEFMPQDTIQKYSMIKLQDDVMQIIKKLKKMYVAKYT